MPKLPPERYTEHDINYWTLQAMTKKTKEFTQYTKQLHGYLPCSLTYNELPAGFYRLELVGNAHALVRKDITSDNIITLPDSESTKIINEIKDFWTKNELFKQHGLSHKRGILLYGPPGSGKTTTALTIALNIVKEGGLAIQVDTDPFAMTQMLAKVRQVEPDRPIVILLEDIDALVKEWSESEVLSLLDGEQSINNVVYVATTNYPDELDKRITDRPSRFDRLVKIDFPTAEGRKVYLRHHNIDEYEEWARATEGFSIAHIKELIVSVKCLGHNFETELKRLKGMYKTPKSEFKSDKVGF